VEGRTGQGRLGQDRIGQVRTSLKRGASLNDVLGRVESELADQAGSTVS
jgi:hypothetical protein